MGTYGCGKSSVIRKGLKSHKLSEATSYTPAPGNGGVEGFRCKHSDDQRPVDDRSSMIIFELSDIYRVGRLNFNQAHDHILRVLEIDISDLDLTSGNVRGIVPEGAPPIDGVVICYDSSESSSFDKVEAVLREHND